MTHTSLCVRCGLEPPMPSRLVCELCATDECFPQDDGGPDDLLLDDDLDLCDPSDVEEDDYE